MKGAEFDEMCYKATKRVEENHNKRMKKVPEVFNKLNPLDLIINFEKVDEGPKTQVVHSRQNSSRLAD